MELIECQGVSKHFGEKTALDHLTLSMPEGKIFGLLGPNGAGKTTLIRIINRITIQDEGQILFKGNPISREDVARIGYLPEERGLYRKAEVGEQLVYLARLKGMTATDARNELVKWFQIFGIESWWKKKVQELSKGMAQKVQFISTVVHKPSLLILDEPFSGFDPVNAELIRKQILRLNAEGATIVLSTHNMESVEELCDGIALINNSKLVVTGGVEEIRRQHGKNHVELIYTEAEPEKALEAVSGLFKIVSDTVNTGRHTAILSLEQGASSNQAIDAVISQNAQVKAWKELIPRMNDIFIKLVTEGE